MRRQRRAFLASPQTWKQRPHKTPDAYPESPISCSSSSSPLPPHLHLPHPLLPSSPLPCACLSSCPVNHFLPPQLSPSASSRPTCFSPPPPSLLHLFPSFRPSLHGLLRVLLVLLASLCFLPCPVQAGWFRVGVVGPWGCDPLFAKALPSVAAQLAVNRISKDPSLSYSTTFDYVVLQEPCQTSKALDTFLGFYTKASGYVGPANPGYCEAASMLSKGWNKAVFPWGCVDYELDDIRSHPTFARSMPKPTSVLLKVMRHFRWAHVAIISSSDDIWLETANKVANSLRNDGMPVKLVAITENTPDGVRGTLAKIRKMKHIRMVILCMHSVLIGGRLQKLLLETAYDMQLIDGSLVFVPYDALLYSLPYRNVSYPALRSNSKLLRAYDAVLTITINSPETSFYEAYEEAMERGEVARTLMPQQVSPLFGTIYSSVLFMAHAVRSVKESGEWMSGGNLARHPRNLDFQVLTLYRGLMKKLHSVLKVLEKTGNILEVSVLHNWKIHYPRGSGPRKDSPCWFKRGTICSGAVLTLAFGNFRSKVGHFRSGDSSSPTAERRIQQIRMVKGPNKILLTLDDVTFINPSLSNKVSLWPVTANSLIHPVSRVVFFSCVQMKDMRHENVNPFLGFFHDCGVFAIVTEFCSRGSLEDLLFNEDVKLDWMFKSSLLLDLIKGMKYLHLRGVSHSRLKSRNCVVDGRFVLKVTDFGYNEVLEAQRFPYVEPTPEELLWTAPEILRNGFPGLHGSFTGDVYSFAIIMQEVVVRAPPFCMLDLPAAEIIEKIRKPPPLCRPVVSPDYAPMECIQLMKQCWNEQPEKRPPFEEIFDQFKNINKGRKTNIIDSMLRMLEQYSSNLEELIRERTEELEIEKQKTEKLLTQMLPPSVAEALKKGCTVEPEHFDSVSLYFSDIVGFTTISANSEPIEVVDLLNDLYTIFDAIIGNHDVYKVETIGDAYMVASGVPVLNENRHAAEIANMALDILSAVGTFKMRHMPDVPVRIRIGLHTGPCVAGVVGLTMPRYCLFGDTVTTASRMESSGLPYRIHVHESTVKILLELKQGYKVELRSRTELKGKGVEETYWLVGKEGFTKPLPVPPEIKSGSADQNKCLNIEPLWKQYQYHWQMLGFCRQKSMKKRFFIVFLLNLNFLDLPFGSNIQQSISKR
uniref:Guanylate cyclase n=1 Tax=Myripristis murdjan TaxID=586833 RepID=A0A667Z8N3_9TELE